MIFNQNDINPILFFTARKGLYVKAFFTSIIILYGTVTNVSLAQTSNEPTPFEIATIIESCQDQLSELQIELNLLKRDDILTHELKDNTTKDIENRFLNGGDTYVQTNLKAYNNFENTNTVPLSTYLIDYQISSNIVGVLFELDSIQFTIPRESGKNVYDVYFSFYQKFLGTDSEGNIFQKHRQLALFQVSKDPTTYKLSAKIASINFLNPRKVPSFTSISADVIVAEFRAFRKSISAPADSVFVYDSEIGKELHGEFVKGIQKSTEEFEKRYNEFLAAQNSGDILKAAQAFNAAKTIKRLDPKILSVDAEFQKKLNREIERTKGYCESAIARWEHMETDSLIDYAENLLGAYHDLFSQSSRFEKDIIFLKNQSERQNSVWQKYSSRIRQSESRQKLKDELQTLINNSAKCSPDNPNDSIASANFLMGKIALASQYGNWKADAISHFQFALDCKPDYTYASNELLKLLTDSKDKIALYDNLINYNEQNADYHFRRAVYLSKSRSDIDKAIESLQKSVEIDSKHFNAHALMAELYARKQLFVESKSAGEKAFTIQPAARNSIILTYACLELEGSKSECAGKYSASFSKKELLHTERRLLDSIAEIYIAETTRYMEVIKGQYENAVEVFEKMYVLVGHLKSFGKSWTSAAECYNELGRNPEYIQRAIYMAKRGADETKGHYPRAYLIWGRSLNLAKEYREADDKFAKLCELQSDYICHFERGLNLLEERRDISSARYRFLDALSFAEKNKNEDQEFDAVIQIAICFRLEKQLDESEKWLKRAIKIKKDNRLAYFQMGLTLQASDNQKTISKSIKLFEKAESMGFNSYLCLSNIARSHYLSDDYADALYELNKISSTYLDQMSETDRLTRAIINILHSSDYNAARLDLNTIVKNNTQFTESYDYLVWYSLLLMKELFDNNSASTPLVKSNIINDSKIQFNKARELNEKLPLAYFGLSLCAYYEHKMPEASDYFLTALKNKFSVTPFKNDKVFRDFFRAHEIRDILRKH